MSADSKLEIGKDTFGAPPIIPRSLTKKEVKPHQQHEGRDERGRHLVLPPAMKAKVFKKGEVHNPSGRSGEYQRCMVLCRSASHEAAQEIIRLSHDSADDRVRYMAASWVYERAWGKVKDYDPAAEKPADKFDPRAYTPDQLDIIEAALRLMVNQPSTKPAAETETGPEGPV